MESGVASWWAQYDFVVDGFVAGLFASVACGLGALPLAWQGLRLEERVGLGYAFAGGLMFSASVYNLLMPAFTFGSDGPPALAAVLKTLLGMAAGAALLWMFEKKLKPEHLQSGLLRHTGGRMEALVFLGMMLHSIPEGVAVGVGYGSEHYVGQGDGLGRYIAIAIGIHNIPEGLAVALPMRLKGASIAKCFFFAFLTSLPQPIAAVPSGLLVWLFEPLLLPFLGFAAGAMMYLVLMELVPEALERHTPSEMAWMFLGGFGMMALVQTAL